MRNGPPDRRPGTVARAGWEPSYWGGVLENSFGDEFLKNDLLHYMVRRTGHASFLQLAELVLLHSADADRVVLVEQINAPFPQRYAFALLVRRGDRYWCYTSLPAPAFSYDGPMKPLWGRLGPAAIVEARAFLALLDGEDVWLTSPSRAILVEEQGTKPVQAWLVHAYRKDDARSVSWVLGSFDRSMDRDVIRGARSLASLPKRRPPGWGWPSRNPETDEPWPGEMERVEREAKAYEQSYPGRLTLHGLLRLARKAGGD